MVIGDETRPYTGKEGKEFDKRTSIGLGEIKDCCVLKKD
jgi:hypothetical protein